MEKMCPICRGTGWKLKNQDGIEVVERCSCSKATKQQELLRQARIPDRYAQCTFDSFTLEQCEETQRVAKTTVEYFVQLYPAVEGGLLLMGPPGTGKTHLAVAALKYLVEEKQVSCLFYDFQDLLKTIQRSYSKDTDLSEMTVLSPVMRTEVLVLDELGASKISAWTQDTLTHIINGRYNNKLITIITSNWMDQEMIETSNSIQRQEEETLDKRIGYRLRSRLYEMCETVQIASSSSDYRKFLHAKHKTNTSKFLQNFPG